MDFASDSLVSGRLIKCLTFADDFSHERVAINRGLRHQRPVRVPAAESGGALRGNPAASRTDNGPEFIYRAVIAWPQELHIQCIFIKPEHPMQNGYIESFNGKFREEFHNEHWTQNRRQARSEITVYRRDCNEMCSTAALAAYR